MPATCQRNRGGRFRYELVKDTSPGVHDMLISACDLYRYHQLIPALRDIGGYHENCSDNLHNSLEQALSKVTNDIDGINIAKLLAGLRRYTPDPLNLFMNIPWKDPAAQGEIAWEAPVSKRGDYVELQALRDLVIAFSACPQDVVGINGGGPVDAEFEVLD